MSVACEEEAVSVLDCVVLDQYCKDFYHKPKSHNLNSKSFTNGKSDGPVFIFDGDSLVNVFTVVSFFCHHFLKH